VTIHHSISAACSIKLVKYIHWKIDKVNGELTTCSVLQNTFIPSHIFQSIWKCMVIIFIFVNSVPVKFQLHLIPKMHIFDHLKH
jgi:hypothetical protein